MTAPDILRIAVTIGVVQLVCDLISNWKVFSDDSYQRALAAVQRTKAKLDKEQQQEQPTGTNGVEKNKKNQEKYMKRLKRCEDDYADAKGAISRIHIVPNIISSIVFILLFRIFGEEFKGAIVGVLPFSPFGLLRRMMTARGLTFKEDALTSFEGSPLVNDIHQAFSFTVIYVLSTLSVKYYVNKLVGTSLPPGCDGMASLMDSPQGQKMMRSMGLDPDMLKMD